MKHKREITKKCNAHHHNPFILKGLEAGETSPKGQVLIITIILILVTGIIISSVAFFLNQVINLNLARMHQAKAVYAAQAGIYKAVVDYVNTGSITAETDTQIATNIFYSIGGAGMFFLPDCSNPSIIADRRIKNISMTNVSTTDITITHVQVSWTPDGGENLTAIDFGRATVEWSGTAQSGTNIDTIDFTLAAGVTENDVWFDWEPGTKILGGAEPWTITAVYTLSDGSTVTFTMLENGQGTDNAIVITSTGKVIARETWKRTIKAGYDVSTSEITSWRESTAHL
ncbi:MAG: hypothetical protein HQ572_00925 [Candidatus Omnitrophica bacterium]|nr:hypothetical protein [Candidatus Omnitrophota bacterium]